MQKCKKCKKRKKHENAKNTKNAKNTFWQKVCQTTPHPSLLCYPQKCKKVYLPLKKSPGVVNGVEASTVSFFADFRGVRHFFCTPPKTRFLTPPKTLKNEFFKHAKKSKNHIFSLFMKFIILCFFTFCHFCHFCIFAYMQTYVHTRARTCVHTRIHAYTRVTYTFM